MSDIKNTDWNDIAEDHPLDPDWEVKEAIVKKVSNTKKVAVIKKVQDLSTSDDEVKSDSVSSAFKNCNFKPVKSEKTDKIDKPDKSEKIDKPDKPEKTDKPVKSDKTDKTVKSEKTDRPDKQEKHDRPDKQDKKYYPHVPCWYLVHNFQCMQSECWFNHNPTIIKEHKLKRENKVCHLYRKCDKRCNKFHNMDELMELYTAVNSKLSAIESIIKT